MVSAALNLSQSLARYHQLAHDSFSCRAGVLLKAVLAHELFKGHLNILRRITSAILREGPKPAVALSPARPILPGSLAIWMHLDIAQRAGY